MKKGPSHVLDPILVTVAPNRARDHGTKMDCFKSMQDSK